MFGIQSSRIPNFLMINIKYLDYKRAHYITLRGMSNTYSQVIKEAILQVHSGVLIALVYQVMGKALCFDIEMIMEGKDELSWFGNT